jgi:hypothetical protein
VSRTSPVISRARDAVEQLLKEADLRPGEDGLWTDAGHTVGVARSAAGLFVGWLDVGWIGTGHAFSEMRDVSHLAAGVRPEHLSRELAIALDEAGSARADHLRDCGRCRERFVPGQMYGADCCHSCATRDLGVIF